VASDGFAVEQQRRDRLAERPCELAVAAGLALVDPRAFGMKRDDRAFAGAAIAGGTCADAAPASVEAATIDSANIAMRMGRPPPLADRLVETP
jgi:hypothetical protein